MLSEEKKAKKCSVFILFVFFFPQIKSKPQTNISPTFVGLGADMNWINQDANMSWEG